MFTKSDLVATAGPTIFNRGIDYVRFVVDLRLDATSARASIEARNNYSVRLSWARAYLDGECSCPHNADGNFCKHLVAVGLAAIDGTPHHDTSDLGPPAGVASFLDELDRPALIDLISELMARDESARHLVEAHATAAGSPNLVDADELVARVNAAMPRGFVDYRASFPAAERVQSTLDELDALLGAGAAEQAIRALERATVRMRKVVLHADDSAGVLGDAGQRAAELHARACSASPPDPRKLGRWLAKFRADSPGWPDVTLEMYAPALGPDGIATYRSAVAKLATAAADVSFFERHELDRMLLELADHDSDVEQAVRILSRDSEHVCYGAIIDRLEAAGRSAETVEWLDRVVAAGKLATSHRGGSEYWLAPQDVVRRYLEAGRDADALAVAGNCFAADIGPASFGLLMQTATKLSCAEERREWALKVAESQAQRRSDGSALVELALAEDDLVRAWAAAERFGAGAAWRRLADASENDLPVAAADLYRPELNRMLQFPDTKIYPGIAKILATIRALYARVGEQATIDAEIVQLRETYRRRTSLIAALDRAGLP